MDLMWKKRGKNAIKMLTSQLLIPRCDYQAMYNWFELSNHIPFTKYFEGGVDTLIQQRVLINTQKACTHTQPPTPRTHAHAHTHLCLSHLIQPLYLISCAFKEHERLCTCSGVCVCVCVILHVISKLSNLVMVENKANAMHWNDHLGFGLSF